MFSKEVEALCARWKTQTPEEFRRGVEKARRKLHGLPPLAEDEAPPQQSETHQEGNGTRGGNLDPRQLRCVDLLLAGHGVVAIAAKLGVNRTTIHDWRQREDFQAEVRRRRDEMAGLDIQLGDAAQEALATLRTVLAEEPSARLRLQAARAILSAARHLPEAAAQHNSPAKISEQGTREEGQQGKIEGVG